MILFEDRAATVLYKVLTKIKNKKFLLPLNVCPIVPDTLIKAGKEFEFCDIELDTLCMDSSLIFDKIKEDESIDGLLFVKTFGVEVNTQPLYQKVKSMKNDLFIIDDMCPSIQRFDYDIENSYADMALFSSGYSKYVDIGFGGYGFVKEREFRDIFENQTDTDEFIAYKREIEENIKLMRVHKKSLNDIYKEIIDPKYYLGDKWNNWRFSLMVENKGEILEEIFKVDGLFASSHYPQVDYEYVKSAQKNSNTKKIHDKILNLFNDFRYDKEKAIQTANIVNKVIK